MGKRELVALLSLSSWCLVIVVWLFLTMPQVCLQFVIVVLPDHTHILFLNTGMLRIKSLTLFGSSQLGKHSIYKGDFIVV